MEIIHKQRSAVKKKQFLTLKLIQTHKKSWEVLKFKFCAHHTKIITFCETTIEQLEWHVTHFFTATKKHWNSQFLNTTYVENYHKSRNFSSILPYWVIGNYWSLFSHVLLQMYLHPPSEVMCGWQSRKVLLTHPLPYPCLEGSMHSRMSIKAVYPLQVVFIKKYT